MLMNVLIKLMNVTKTVTIMLDLIHVLATLASHLIVMSPIVMVLLIIIASAQ